MKRLFFIILFLFCSNANAQSPILRDVWYDINNFSEMLNSQTSPYLIKKGAGAQAQNLRSNEAFGALAKRGVMLQYGSCSSSKVEGMHRYYKSDSTKYLMIGSGANLYVGDDSGGVCTTIGNGFTDGARWQFETYKDIAIGLNGNEQPIKYDGSIAEGTADGDRTANYQVAELGSPFAELNTGANLDTTSWYAYKIQCTDGSTNWFFDALSNAILTGSSVRDVRLTDIPLCPSTATSRTIYRTEGQASAASALSGTFKVLATIADNTTRTYDDAIADGSLGATWSSSGKVDLTPPIAKLILIHKDRIFLANQIGTTFGKSTIFWSKALNPDVYYSADDFELIRPDDGDEITGLANQLGLLLIFKQNSIQKFFTDSSNTDNWEISAPFSKISAIATYSVASSPLGVFFLSEDGIYLFNGQSSQLISDKVTDKIRDILRTNLDDIVGYFYKNLYHLAYTSKASGSGDNNRVLVYDNVRDAYTLDLKDISSFTAFNSGNDFNVLHGGSSLTDGKIWAFDDSPVNLIWRSQTDLDEATEDSLTYFGTESSPGFELGWGITIDDSSLSSDTIDGYSPATAIIDRPTTTGTWYSNNVQVSADAFSKLFWNESLTEGGDVVFSLRTASTEGGLSGASWSGSFTDPSGSDISGITANVWLQIKGVLTTNDITLTPQVSFDDSFVIKLVYNQTGATKESSVISIWESGFEDFQLGNSDLRFLPKRIKEILVYYEGEQGTLAFNIKNSEASIDHDFSVDMTVLPSDSTSDDYFGDTNEKIYRYIPSAVEAQITGRQFQITLTEQSQTEWKVNRVSFRFDVHSYTTMR